MKIWLCNVNMSGCLAIFFFLTLENSILMRDTFNISKNDLYSWLFNGTHSNSYLKYLNRSGFKPKRSLEVILFTSEEPTRFGISCLGRLEPLSAFNFITQ